MSTAYGASAVAPFVGSALAASTDVDILNFALTLEYLETAFYEKGKTVGLSGQAKSLAKSFGDEEAEHVAALMKAITASGGKPVKKPMFVFPVKDQKSFLKLAYVLENTGVGAYNGAGPALKSKALLAAAGSIVQIEARHAVAGIADENLMLGIHRGDAAAFEVVFDRHSDAAFSLAYRMCGRRATAEDIVQEAFLSLWRGGGRYDRTRGSVRSWVLGVVHHRAVDLFRRDAIRAARDVSDDEALEAQRAPGSPARDVGRRDDAAATRIALSDLPDDQRHAPMSPHTRSAP